MSKYIIADVKRVLKIVSYWIIVILMIWFCSSFATTGGVTSIDMVDAVKTLFVYACVPCGFLEIIYILGEDLKARKAQIAIGVGVSKGKVIIAKWIECIIIATIQQGLLLLAVFLYALKENAAFSASDWREVILVVIMSIVTTGVYLALVFPIITAAGGTSLAMVIYIFLSTGLINKGLSYLELLRPIQRLHIIGKTPTNLINVCRSRMVLGTFALGQWIGVVLFIVAFLGLSVFIYQRQELEF